MPIRRRVSAFLSIAFLSIADAASARTIEVNLLYVHGVKNCTTERQNAQNSLTSLGNAITGQLSTRIATWQAAHPGDTVVVTQKYANLYTATHSGFNPSDSTNPLLMDDWEVGDPGCTTTKQGDPCTTAFEWRYRLAMEINRLYPSPKKNIILVGHSTGGRVAMEVAANAGPSGVNTFDWGVQGRIAGVVTLHGMVDEIGSSKYDVAGPLSFETTCKNGDAAAGWGDSCSQGNGWCEYAGRVSGFNAADWVAKSKRALNLISWASCSPSLFAGRTDGPLPYDAQGSPWAVGLDMTPTTTSSWRVAHGQKYGSFCHSDLTSTSSTRHASARDAARNRILDWLFVAAPRVAATGSNTTATLALNATSSTYTMGAACATGEKDDNLTAGNKATGIDIVGNCKHPGTFDGDDHTVAAGEITVVSNGSTCNGSYKWKQAHDSNNSHSAVLSWKTRSLRTAGPDLVNSLP
jgi:pimeloyl-ACP methyl ester carboxylesterase